MFSELMVSVPRLNKAQMAQITRKVAERNAELANAGKKKPVNG
jgi:hypothetical protein